ncbi:16S rRNA (cytosine(967)-C(5))-methyltransferase RsmB [bacterium]
MKKKDPRRLAVWIVDRVFRSNSYADILLETQLTERDFSRKDRAFITELVYGTIRWVLYLDWILKNTYTSKWLNIPALVRRILEVGAYQILFLDRVPIYAAINESVNITKETMGDHWSKTVNALLRNIERKKGKYSLPSPEEDPIKAISVGYSHPDWMIRKWLELWGPERTIALCQANNERPKLGLRINPLRTDRIQVLNRFDHMGLSTAVSDFLPNFITVDKGGELLSSPLFQKGYVTVQDVSAGLVGYLLDPKPGETVLDMAAAPGGKSTLIAELCEDRCIIYAMDINDNKIKKIIANKKRLSLKKIYCLRGDGFNVPLNYVNKVLVDAPCSGLGVLGKRTEIRWRRKPEDIPGLVRIQKKLLDSAAKIVQKDGIIVYSTCTILPEENAEIVQYFMNTYSNFIIENASQFVPEEVVSADGFVETWPDKHGIDGSFAVRFRKVK